MVVIDLYGGMGNQLFAFALGRSLEARGKSVYFNRQPIDSDPKRNYCLNKFGLNLQFSQPIGRVVREQNGYFDSTIFDAENCTLSGYWQSEKYFECVAPFIREELINSTVKDDKSNNAFVHVRRGDYVTEPHTAAYHGFPGFDYYMRGIGYLENQVHPSHYYVYSDDIKWCQEHFNDPKITVVNSYSDYWDLQAMVTCKYAVISNSSFSWWGAWLGNAELVVVPKKWFVHRNEGDIVPKRWIRL